MTVPLATIVANRAAGPFERASALMDVVREVERAGFGVDVRHTERRGHATDLAREAMDRGHTLLLAAGGDGTLNEVIQAAGGTSIVVGAVPFGSVNVWTRELGLSLDPVQTTRQLMGGEALRLDLGRANGRYFLLMAGLGMDAVAVHASEGEAKRRFGPLAIFAAGARYILTGGAARIRVRVDGDWRAMRAAQVSIGNTRYWAGPFQITDRASAADGLLDVCFFGGRTLLDKLRHTVLVLVRRHRSDPHVTYLHARELLVAARPRLLVQVDGEPLGLTPIRFEVAPSAVTMLTGASAAACLQGATVVHPAPFRALPA
ncbi:MAG: diacylglycerol kinase family protein [Chloroflexota bacterium]